MFARLIQSKSLKSLASLTISAAAISTFERNPNLAATQFAFAKVDDAEQYGTIPDLTKKARQQFEKDAKATAYKDYFVKSYDEVAEVVDAREKEELENTTSGDLIIINRLRRAVAKVLMERLGYSMEELEIIGNNVDRMQGTGNPFPHANLQQGDVVLDLGSGFGVDAELAGYKVGETGRVVGIDMSVREVSNANKRVLEKGITNVRFYEMDIENMKAIPDSSIDVVISNGGFCLVPNKRRAFQEIRRVLKPKGRFSISCTTLQKGYGSINKFMTDEISEGDYPSCMEVFMPLDVCEPLLLDLGFEDVVVDASNSKMSVWDDVEKAMQDEVDRELAKLHGILPNVAQSKAIEKEEASFISTQIQQEETQKQEIKQKETQKEETQKQEEKQEEEKQTDVKTLSDQNDTKPSKCPSFALEDLDVEIEQADGGGVHTGNPKYAHLSALSMDDICARVVLVGVNPSDVPEDV